MIQKVGKKEKKKQKAIQKALEGQFKPSVVINQQPKKINTLIKYTQIPSIKTDIQDNLFETSSFPTIVTGNKKITVLIQEVMNGLKNHKKVSIVGENVYIPKAISIVEIVKRDLGNKNRLYKQDNLLGVCNNKNPCIRITLQLEGDGVI